MAIPSQRVKPMIVEVIVKTISRKCSVTRIQSVINKGVKKKAHI